MKTTERSISLTCGIMSALAITSAQSQVLFNHAGATDPTSEVWTQVQSGSGPSVGPVINDLGTGLNAWSVASSTSTGLLAYTQTPTAAQIQQGNLFGWSLSATLRITRIPDLSLDASPSIAYITGPLRWNVFLGAQADGDPVVSIPAQGNFALEGGGSGYHTYRLTYDPASSTADFFIDGVERISNLSPVALFSPPEVYFGIGTAAPGGANFNSVTFAVVPEPSSWALLFLGGVSLGFVFRSRHHDHAA